MGNGAQLITYPDSLGGSLRHVDQLLAGPFAGLFPNGVHVLPPFPSSGDRGFAPIRCDMVDPAFGTEDDLRAVAAHGGLILDLMVNHISARSVEFEDFINRGRSSEWADLFITADKVFPDGVPSAEDLAPTALRRADGPLLRVELADGSTETVWATFADRASGRCEQIDIDLGSQIGKRLVREWIGQLAGLGTTTIRLDAVGYATKKAGTASFMLEPQIWELLADLAAMADEVGAEILPEVHADPSTHHALVVHGYRSYDFVLPALVLHALFSGRPDALGRHLASSPSLQITTLDSHDGIPIMPDLTGVLDHAAMENLVATCVERGANVSRVFNSAPGSPDAHQVNITYRDAVGSDEAYLAARAVQLFAPGIPQIYYVGLLGGRNDQDAVAADGDGRSVNRHNFTSAEIEEALSQPMLQQLHDLIRLRNCHPAFAGTPEFATTDTALTASWTSGTDQTCLRVDFENRTADIQAT